MPSKLQRRQFGTRVDASAANEGIVRVAPLLGVPALLRGYGIDATVVLASVGLAPGTLDHPDRTISYIDAGRLLQRCAEVTGCPHFGLLVGQRNNISALGLLGELMLRSASAQAALRSMILHIHLQTRGGIPTHTVEGVNATFGYAIYQRGMPATTHIYDLVIAYAFNVMRSLCGPNWVPLEVSFSHKRPEDLRPYRKFFDAPLRFDAERTAILFSKTSHGSLAQRRRHVSA